AARLHAKSQRRSSCRAWLEGMATWAVAVLRSTRLAPQADAVRLVRVRDDVDHVGQTAQLVGPSRGVTTSDKHADGWVLSRNASNCLARALIGTGGHRARVDGDETGLVGRDVARP